MHKLCHVTTLFIRLPLGCVPHKLFKSLRDNEPSINDPIPIHFNTHRSLSFSLFLFFLFSQLLWQLVTICLSLIIIIIIIIIFGLNPFVDFIAQRWQRTALSFKLNGKRQQFAQLRYYHLHCQVHLLPHLSLVF